jgi:pimeloyl-ACP methyl ester carboxylesterase
MKSRIYKYITKSKCIIVYKYLAYVTKTNEVKLNSIKIDSARAENTKYMVFLHGLFGNANNWRYIAYSEPIRDRRNSILIDLRNHGESDHHDSMGYPEMAQDVIRHLNGLGVKRFTLLGHSMGAKTAMNIATMIPEQLDGLVIVDAAPKDNSKDLSIYSSTKEVVDKVGDYDITDKTRREAMEDFKNMFVRIYVDI